MNINSILNSILQNEAVTKAILDIVVTIIVTLLGVVGAWITSMLGKRTKLANILRAKSELIETAQQTVLELQQTVVEGLKAASTDGKLSEDEITELSMMLLNKTKQKMSLPAIQLLEAASVDVNSLIRGAGEALIAQMHEDVAANKTAIGSN